MKIKAWTIIPILILICEIGCRPEKKFKNQTDKKEFEGKITYHEIIKDSIGSIDIDDTVQLFYFDGNFVGIHSSRSPRPHLVKDYYLADKSLRLMLFNSSDTLFQLSLNLPSQRLDSFRVKKTNEKLFSRNCEIAELNVSFPEKSSTTFTDISYTFSRDFFKKIRSILLSGI